MRLAICIQRLTLLGECLNRVNSMTLRRCSSAMSSDSSFLLCGLGVIGGRVLVGETFEGLGDLLDDAF